MFVCITNLMLLNRIKEINAFSSFAGTIGGSNGTKEIYILLAYGL